VQIRCHRKTGRAEGGGDAGVHRCNARRLPQSKVAVEDLSRESKARFQNGNSERW